MTYVKRPPVMKDHLFTLLGVVSQNRFDSIRYLVVHKSQEGLPLEPKNTQNHENQRLSLIASLHVIS